MALYINFFILEQIKTKKTYAVTDGFLSIFEFIITNDFDFFCMFKSGKSDIDLETAYSGKMIFLPIPPGMMTSEGACLNTSDAAEIHPLIISFEPLGTSPVSEEHFCHGFTMPMETGTSCTLPLHHQTYFKSQTPIPRIKGNPLLDFYVEKYKQENKEKELYYVPLYTPNQTVQYVIFNNEKDAQDLLNKCSESIEKGEKYYIGLDGFIIYVDQWDCSIFLANYLFDHIEIDNKKLSVPSKVHFHHLKKP